MAGSIGDVAGSIGDSIPSEAGEGEGRDSCRSEECKRRSAATHGRDERGERSRGGAGRGGAGRLDLGVKLDHLRRRGGQARGARGDGGGGGGVGGGGGGDGGALARALCLELNREYSSLSPQTEYSGGSTLFRVKAAMRYHARGGEPGGSTPPGRGR